MSSNNLFTLPAGPSELCFDKNEFMKPTFSVDDFLHEHRNAASLEIMRDDLGTYLKILRLAMIELINQDYGDFVNLSNKLVGLHEHINNIRKSLELLQINITEIKDLIESVMNEITHCLKQKKLLIKHKKTLKSLTRIQQSIDKLCDLFDNHLINSSNNEIEPTVLERASLELMQLQFHSKFCEKYLKNEQKIKIDELNKKFLNNMRIYFLKIINSSATMNVMTSSSSSSSSNLDKNLENNNNSNNNEDLERCLRIYASLDKFNVAENVFQEKVSDYMKTRITEQRLQNSKDGLSEIYIEILNFISLHMKDILLLTYYTDKIKGYNFLINSYWNDIEKRLETNLSSIFAPGNPDNFYINYKCTQNFLKKFETILGNDNAIKKFRQHELTKKFNNRWNLPVYFQIRFQEITSPLENHCYSIDCIGDSGGDGGGMVISNNDSSKIISLFNSSLNRISLCWSDGVYIDELFPKFLKLTIQIISRICKCIENYLETIKINIQGDTTNAEIIIKIYLEIHNLLHKIPNIIEIILDKMPKNLINYQQQIIDNCFENVRKQIESLLLNIEKLLVKMISLNCEKNIRQVNDIPRLYRKTNRELPNKPSLYIQNVVNAIDEFIKKFDVLKSSEKKHKILLQIFITTTEKYFNIIQEVLISVQKTEESLKRLKSLRDKTQNFRNSPERSTISDDDKIRLQLQLDVMHWHDNIMKNEFQKNDIKNLSEMINLLEDVTKIKTST